MKKYTKEFLENIIKDCTSIFEVCRKVGISGGSGSATIKRNIKKFNIDISHFKGSAWNKGMKGKDETAVYPLKELLDNNVKIKSNTLKHKLFANGLKENRCEICGLEGKEVTLELHHINGDHFDNRIENLQILCPNCHSKTPNYRRKNGHTRKQIKSEDFKDLSNVKLKLDSIEKVCQYCGKSFITNACRVKRKFCSRECYSKFVAECGQKFNQNINRENNKIDLSKEYILKHMENYDNMTSFSEFLNISRTTLRKILDNYDLLDEFKSKYDLKATKIIQYDMNMNFIKEWPSITDAEETLGIKSISKVINLKQRSAGGYIWRRKKD